MKTHRNAMVHLAMRWFALLLAFPAWGAGLHDHPSGIWSLEATAQEKRWLIIHNLSQGRESGVYHLEVIARRKGDPVWKIQHLAKHMAIREAALLRSIRQPLNKGAVYPESFLSAYQQWQQQNHGAGGAICETTVVQCLP